MIKKSQHNNSRKRVLLFFLLICFTSFLVLSPKKVGAQVDTIGGPVAVVRKVTDWFEKNFVEMLKKTGSRMFHSALQVVTTQLATDLGSWVGSGFKGQNPLFEPGYIEDAAKNAGNAAFAEALDSLGQWNINLCEPNLDIKVKIGGFLVNHKIPQYTPKCSFKEMQKAWTNEFDKWTSMTAADFLENVAKSMDPTGNDLGISMSIFDQTAEMELAEKAKAKTQLITSGGWLDNRGVDDKSTGPPEMAAMRTQQAIRLQEKGFGEITGDIFTDMVNIFTNQTAITVFNRFITYLLETSQDMRGTDSEFTNPFSLTNPGAADLDPSSYSSETILLDKMKKVLKPKFTEKLDYSVLADLIICQGENEYTGPNNCVIDQSFSRAIENENTLIEAINGGSISPGMLFIENGNQQSTLNRRTLMILRKFRIIPIAWEEALNRITPMQKTNSGQYTIMDLLSCFSASDEYNEFSKNFPHNPNDEDDMLWCRGLIDPHWVLKAPLSYCARQGYGGHILSTQIITTPEVLGNDESVVQEAKEDITIIRSDTYCADQRSCIKENSDGACQVHGYCTEEKRTWNFNQNSCSAVYNTCESFTSSSGKKLALLKNTVKYPPCDAGNSGCSIYSTNGTYYSSNASVAWNSNSLINLNSKAETCSATSEGCNEFIRTRSGFGHNFIINGDFEADNGWETYVQQGSLQSGIGYEASRGVLLNSGDLLSGSVVVGPDDNFLKGETFTFSFYSKCTATSTASIANMSNENLKTILPSSDFAYQSVSYTYPDNFSGSEVSYRINIGTNAQCYIDRLKLEKGTSGTFYSDYRDNALIYLKTIPDYLKNTCYINPSSSNPDFRLKPNAPSECYRYARLCNFNEFGCQMFKMGDGREVPAKAMDKDYCPGECEGYDVYVQKSTIFESDYPYRLIPMTAKKCSAASVACTQFTNLEDLSSGGEKVEYYSYLRQCIKPDEGVCSNFYSWQGSEGSGYQLKSFNLSLKNNQPSLTAGDLFSDGQSYKHVIDGVDVCSKQISKLAISDPRYNSDCREFYNQAGDIFYVLYSKTMTCSNDCKLFRMTERNIDRGIQSASECNALNSAGKKVAKWGTANVEDYASNQSEDSFVCFRCLNGGYFDETQNACIYKAIPGEGKTCSASENLCREYSGNSSNNIKIVASYDFESGLSSFSGGSESSESLSNNGKSIKIDSSTESSKDLSGLLKKGSSYLVSFLAKNNSAGSSNLEVYFSNSSGKKANFEIIDIVNGSSNSNISINGSAWQVYKINLENLDHDVDSGEKIYLKNNGSGTLYIDDLIISETINKYYLIKNSWKTPNICYYDQTAKYQGPNYNLGCAPYLDKANNRHSLRQFSKLCDSSAVGCEMMIDTHNYSPKEGAVFTAGQINNSITSCSSGQDCVDVKADNFSLVVYDAAKICNPADKGCSLFGKAISNIYSLNSNYLYQNIYIKNNPDKYNQGILCAKEAVGCDSWSSTAGTSYFKDPGDNVCQYINGDWYVKKIKRCLPPVGQALEVPTCADGDVSCQNDASAGVYELPKPCNSNTDCSLGTECRLDDTNRLCPVDKNYGVVKTIGNEGIAIKQPIAQSNGLNWAGLCPLKDSGCTEYIDPSSSFNPNLILNVDFADIDEDGNYFDGWTAVTPDGKTELSQLTCGLDNDGRLDCSQPASAGKYYFRQSNQFIEPNKLYVIKYNNLTNLRVRCDNTFYKLEGNNQLTPISLSGSNFYEISPLAQYLPSAYASKMLFYSGDNMAGECEFVIDINESTVVKNISIEWKEAIVDYIVKDNLDFSSCNGTPEFDRGCILFNERTIGSGGYPNFSNLIYDSSSYKNYNPTTVDNYKDANSIIKVKPDRTCGKWLACYSYTTEKDEKGNDKNICLQVGQCTSMDASGNCLNFVKSSAGNREFDSAKDGNASGYSLLNNYYLDNMYQRGNSNVFSEDFEGKNYNFAGWTKKINSSSAETAIDPQYCLISKSTDTQKASFKSLLPVYPSPSNFAFARIGGASDADNCEWQWFSPAISTISNNDYYLSFWINTTNFKISGEGSNEKTIGKIVGLANNAINETGAVELKVDVSKKEWQRLTYKFRTNIAWSDGSKLVLSLSDSPSVQNGFVYIDDIRVEPVLEVANNKYLPTSCRLYPRQDSVSCYSDSKGYSFVEQGWYGYCLEKDPANENVCLLWYPIDSVVGSSVSDLSTNFTGYPDSGEKPYYCARMIANFDLVELRETFIDNVHIKAEGSSNQIDDVNCGGCTTKAGYIATLKYDSPREIYNNCRSGLDNDWIKQCYCVHHPGADRIISIPNSDFKIAHFYCKDSVGSNYSQYGTIYDTKICNTDDRNLCFVSSHSSCYSGNNADSYMCFSNPGIRAWYKYDGNLLSGTESNTGIKLLAYNISKTECESGIYDYGQVGDSDYFKAQHFAIGTGTNQCPSSYCNEAGKGACLMHPDKYVPKCDKIVQGLVPWVERLKSTSYNLGGSSGYNTSLPAYFSSYSLGSRHAPFGAINTNVHPGVQAVFASQVSSNPPYNLFGLPYSCKGRVNGVYMSIPAGSMFVNSCQSLYRDSQGKIKVTNNAIVGGVPVTTYSSDGGTFSISGGSEVPGGASANINNALKYVFARTQITEFPPVNYSHLFGGTATIPSCKPGGCPERPANDKNICYVQPQIENIKISGPYGQVNQTATNSNLYNVVSSGFYTISFNTQVDKEQAPIKSLIIKIKKKDERWDQGAPIVLNNIDHKPNSSDPHRLVRFLTPGEYLVAIKVIDNWNYFKCSGIGAFNVANSKCLEECCGTKINTTNSNFYTPFGEVCDGAPDQEFNGCVDSDIAGSLPSCR